MFTAITFPFLFGMMYGDIGHGSVLLIAGIFMVLSENKEGMTEDSMGGLFAARYMILLMGAFAVYCGFVYNDFFALGLNFFGSQYEYPDGLVRVLFPVCPFLRPAILPLLASLSVAEVPLPD